MKRLLTLLTALLLCLALVGCGGGKASAYTGPLLEFEVLQKNGETADLSDAKALLVWVNHCEYGEPTQYIYDADVIAAAVKAVTDMSVTGGSEGFPSTGTHYSYLFQDGEGNTLVSLSFQDGMLMERDDLYPVEGFSALLQVEGIMLEDQWEAYWQEYSELSDSYRESFRPQYPETVFAVGGYDASLMEDIDAARIAYAVIYREGVDDKSLCVEDGEQLARLYAALSDMRVTGKADGGSGKSLSLSLGALNDLGFHDTATFSFEDGCLESDGESYAVEGLEALLAAMP